MQALKKLIIGRKKRIIYLGLARTGGAAQSTAAGAFFPQHVHNFDNKHCTNTKK